MRYIADLHLYDQANVLWRNQAMLIEYDLVQSWNQHVDEEDIVFIVGDIGKQCQHTYNIIRQLKGQKILVLGNHDRLWVWDDEAKSLFNGIHNYILKNNMLLIHDPKDAQYFKAKWVIHGHLHTYEAELLANDHDKYIKDSRRFNCAIDMNCLYPVTFQQLSYNKSLYVAEHSPQ